MNKVGEEVFTVKEHTNYKRHTGDLDDGGRVSQTKKQVKEMKVGDIVTRLQDVEVDPKKKRL